LCSCEQLSRAGTRFASLAVGVSLPASRKELNMLTPEQERILHHLHARLIVPTAELAAACLPGASAAWVNRVLGDLEWLGYVVVYYDAAGLPRTVEMTERGMHVGV
jgi:hypothetical protein